MYRFWPNSKLYLNVSACFYPHLSSKSDIAYARTRSTKMKKKAEIVSIVFPYLFNQYHIHCSAFQLSVKYYGKLIQFSDCQINCNMQREYCIGIWAWFTIRIMVFLHRFTAIDCTMILHKLNGVKGGNNGAVIIYELRLVEYRMFGDVCLLVVA